ncbi:hypothetical protein ASPFODRAFT_481712 [Aspergillus luchuensis CBS 106.47]|uniref:Uncharacterized protein n=1 Tax=Aspergillus luchuensis (strain CBS 106.47) TaxID=1137211 RepID=A0A1M3TQY8_ASPLC|nr:hypothetical protein ASPFODRAFT_481712 [Aspergillus luchuensis CBS 106.47]
MVAINEANPRVSDDSHVLRIMRIRLLLRTAWNIMMKPPILRMGKTVCSSKCPGLSYTSASRERLKTLWDFIVFHWLSFPTDANRVGAAS